MDDYMPNLNGNDSVKKIRKYQKKHETSKQNSFIVITADQDTMVDNYVKEKLIEIAIKNGSDEYLSKPVNIKALKKILDKYVKLRTSF